MGRPRESALTFVSPMMAKLTDKLPEGKQWTYEVKWDGYRALLLKSGDRVRLLSRKENDLTATYPTIEAGQQAQGEDRGQADAGRADPIRGVDK